MKERKDRVDDAMHATRAAVEEASYQAVASRCYAPPRRSSASALRMRTRSIAPHRPASGFGLGTSYARKLTAHKCPFERLKASASLKRRRFSWRQERGLIDYNVSPIST